MAKTIERKEGGALLPPPRGVPAEEMVTAPEQRVELHEMPDLSKEAPEVEYGQPKRSWLRYLAVGVAVGAVAVGGGLAISALTDTDAGFQYGNEYGLAREHLAQAPIAFPMTTSLRMEHLAQSPGGFPDNLAPMPWPNAGPVNDVTGGFGFPMTTSLRMEHLAQTPGGFPDNLAPMSWPNAGPVNDATG